MNRPAAYNQPVARLALVVGLVSLSACALNTTYGRAPRPSPVASDVFNFTVYFNQFSSQEDTDRKATTEFASFAAAKGFVTWRVVERKCQNLIKAKCDYQTRFFRSAADAGRFESTDPAHSAEAPQVANRIDSRWMVTASSNTLTIRVDTSRIVPLDSGWSRLFQRLDFFAPQRTTTAPSVEYAYQVWDVVYDCRLLRIRQVGLTAHNSSGDLVASEGANPEWIRAIPESALEWSMMAICPIALRSAGSRQVEPSQAVASGMRISSTGSAFPITRNGLLLTNYHVVQGCEEVRVRVSSSSASLIHVVASDETNDLAVLKANITFAQAVAFRVGSNIRPADDVIAVGFPFAGLLSDQPNVTTGTVSALAGLGNDSRFLQVTAPIQPGNSGGPLFDISGHLVGVVTETLDALVMAKESGIIPQNVNFAINNSAVRGFLDAHSIRYATARSDSALSKANVAERGRAMTFRVDCWTK